MTVSPRSHRDLRRRPHLLRRRRLHPRRHPSHHPVAPHAAMAPSSYYQRTTLGHTSPPGHERRRIPPAALPRHYQPLKKTLSMYLSLISDDLSWLFSFSLLFARSLLLSRFPKSLRLVVSLLLNMASSYLIDYPCLFPDPPRLSAPPGLPLPLQLPLPLAQAAIPSHPDHSLGIIHRSHISFCGDHPRSARPCCLLPPLAHHTSRISPLSSRAHSCTTMPRRGRIDVLLAPYRWPQGTPLPWLGLVIPGCGFPPCTDTTSSSSSSPSTPIDRTSEDGSLVLRARLAVLGIRRWTVVSRGSGTAFALARLDWTARLSRIGRRTVVLQTDGSPGSPWSVGFHDLPTNTSRLRYGMTASPRSHHPLHADYGLRIRSPPVPGPCLQSRSTTRSLPSPHSHLQPRFPFPSARARVLPHPRISTLHTYDTTHAPAVSVSCFSASHGVPLLPS